MNSKFRSVLALMLACVGSACQGTAPPTTTSAPPAVQSVVSTATVPAPPASSTSTTTTSLAATGLSTTADGALNEAAQECNRFTVGLDRFVFNRLQPILTAATDLLHSPPDTPDPGEVAAGLIGAAEQLGRLVEELDLMGVPPREIVDLVLSIREAVQLFAASFNKGALGWESGDPDLVREARDNTQEAAAVLNSFFGWQLCG